MYGVKWRNHLPESMQFIPCHFGSYKEGKLRGTQHQSRINSAVKSSQLKIVQKCVKFDFKFISVFSEKE